MRLLRQILTLAAGLAAALPAQGKTFLTTAEALALAFPDCKVERQRHVLDGNKKKLVHRLSGHRPCRSMVFAYQAKKNGKVVGTAYFDRHRVRSQRQLVMIVVAPEVKVRRIEVVSFGEPLDYLPRGRFYAQFVGRGLKDKLSTKGAIRSVVGSTLTVNATTAAVRRILGTHQVLFGKPAPEAEVTPTRE